MYCKGYIMLKRVFCIINSVIIFSILLLNTGCVSGKFEVIPPPIKDFPTPIAYEETAASLGTFTIEKSFRGNKGNNILSVISDVQTIKGFSVGEKGTVTYEYKGKTYKYDAVITACPTEGSGVFVASYTDDTSFLPSSFPGKFSVVVFHKENCLMISKSAVMPIDENGNAVVLQLDKNGLLTEKNIVIGQSNDTHYQVLEGLTNGEKVVIR